MADSTHRESLSWVSYDVLHRIWREQSVTPSGTTKAGDHHYLDFGRAVGKLAEGQRTADLRRSLLAHAEEIAAALSRPAVERLIDEAFSHDAVVRARRDAQEVSHG